MHRQHPEQIALSLQQLLPTQITVGKIEVREKRTEWSRLKAKERKKLLESHVFPGVVGPGGVHYITDHHHLGLALLEEEVGEVGFLVLKDMSWLEPKIFWNVMEYFRWVHPYDEYGIRCDFNLLPKDLASMADDPYRSLAGALRRVGGYAKDMATYSEFLWADFLRDKFDRQRLVADFEGVLKQAGEIARSREASYLPGWIGKIPEESETEKEQ